MKTQLILAAAITGATLAPLAASAESLRANAIEVAVPANLSEPGVADAYASELLRAVSRVCARETGPVIGVAYYTYRACIAQTRLDTAQRDPTGILAKQLGAETTLTIAAR